MRTTLAAIAAMAALALTGCGAPNESATANADGITLSSTSEVLYEVEGTAIQANITYSNPNGGTGQQSDIDVPMTTKGGGKQILHFPRGAFVYLSAQNSNSTGNITCRITIDGVVIDENTSYGGFTIATCKGSA